MAATGLLIGILACNKSDSNGLPLNGYKVRSYASDGVTPANVWEEEAKTTPKTEFSLDATGFIEVYGDNTYIFKIWASTADPDIDSPYMIIGPVNYSVTASGNVTGDLTGDIKAEDGTTVLNNGTDGTDATLLADVFGNLTGDVTGDVVGDITGAVTGTASGDASGSASKIGGISLVSLNSIIDWDMDATPSYTAPHALPTVTFYDVYVEIFDDTGTILTPINQGVDNANTTPQGFVTYDSTNVYIYRLDGGIYDSTSYNSPTGLRGTITITYA